MGCQRGAEGRAQFQALGVMCHVVLLDALLGLRQICVPFRPDGIIRWTGEAVAELSGSPKAADNPSVEIGRERSMPDFKQLAEGEKPADPDRYILIEVIHGNYPPPLRRRWKADSLLAWAAGILSV